MDRCSLYERFRHGEYTFKYINNISSEIVVSYSEAQTVRRVRDEWPMFRMADRRSVQGGCVIVVWRGELIRYRDRRVDENGSN